MRRFVEVNEAMIFASAPKETAEWWVLFEAHQPSARLTVMVASIGGNRVRVECDDDEHAEQFVQMLVAGGVPKSAAKVLPAPKRGWEHSCIHRTVRCAGPKSGKPTTKKCGTCGGQWLVRRGTYGVFTWLGDGRYPIAKAHGTFATQKAADGLANKDPRKNWVVRFIDEDSL